MVLTPPGWFVRRYLRNGRKRSARRAFPIHAYVGPNGSGKSLAAVWDTMPSLASGRPVLSTVRLLDWLHPGLDADGLPRAHPLWVPLTEWSQLLEAEHCDVLMDEVTGVASSRESGGMPPAVANLLVQLRRRDVVLRWTAPSWSRADKIIRETSQAVTACLGYWPESHGDGDRLWRRRRLFRWRTYDTADFEEFTVGQRDRLNPWVNQWFWGPGSPAFSAYDTLDQVLSIGHVLESGRCAHCGGRRTAPACSCEDYQAARPSRRALHVLPRDGEGEAV